MSKTDFGNKCLILGNLWVDYRDDAEEDEGWNEFFTYADIGLPLAYMLSHGIANPNDESNRFIDETWTVFCELLDIDPEGEYYYLTECFEASPLPQTPIDDDEDDEE